MRSTRLAGWLLAFSLTFTACSSPGEATQTSQSSDTSTYKSTGSASNAANTASNVSASSAPKSYAPANSAANTSRPAERNKEGKFSAQTVSNEPIPKVIDRKVIRDANLTLEAESPTESQQKITAVAESRGGFVVESNQRSSSSEVSSRDIVRMTVRVPSEKFSEALEEIRKTSTRIVEETVKGQDVTEEFIDLEARIKTKKALEQQYVEIMKRANSIDETMDIQARIQGVRAEIEQIEGRMRFLENSASLSTIRIEIQTPAAIANSTGFFYQLKNSFGSGLSVAVSFVLFFVKVIVAILPFLVLIVLPIGAGLRYFLRKNRKKQTASEIAREEIVEE